MKILRISTMQSLRHSKHSVVHIDANYNYKWSSLVVECDLHLFSLYVIPCFLCTPWYCQLDGIPSLVECGLRSFRLYVIPCFLCRPTPWSYQLDGIPSLVMEYNLHWFSLYVNPSFSVFREVINWMVFLVLSWNAVCIHSHYMWLPVFSVFYCYQLDGFPSLVVECDLHSFLLSVITGFSVFHNVINKVLSIMVSITSSRCRIIQF